MLAVFVDVVVIVVVLHGFRVVRCFYCLNFAIAAML